MNLPCILSASTEPVKPALACVREGVSTARQQLPSLLRIGALSIILSCALQTLETATAPALAPETAPVKILNPDIPRLTLVSLLLDAATLLVIVYSTFVAIRLVSQQPLPAASSQSLRTLWRFESRFLGYIFLAIRLSICGLAFLIPGVLVGLMLGRGALLAGMPLWLAGIPIAWTIALWYGFFVVSSIIFLRNPTAGSLHSIRGSVETLRRDLPLWGSLAVARLSAIALIIAVEALPVLGSVVGSALRETFELVMPFVYLAGYQWVTEGARPLEAKC